MKTTYEDPARELRALLARHDYRNLPASTADLAAWVWDHPIFNLANQLDPRERDRMMTLANRVTLLRLLADIEEMVP